MRKVDENRARGYIKKHERYKKWLAFALCIALITGTGTFYMMNKPATAMTEDGAEQIGVVLEGAETEVEQGTIQQEENNEASAEAGSTVADTSSVLDTVLSGEGSVELNGIADSLTNSEGAVTGDSGVAASLASSADESNAAATLASSADESNAAATLASSADESNAAASLASSADESNAAATLASSADESNAAASLASSVVEDSAAAASSGASLGEVVNAETVPALEVPEKVNVLDYVTSTVIERRLEDGSWEVIQKEDVVEGDYIRITYNYDLPDEAKLSDDIQLEIPMELDFVDIEKATLLDGTGTAEVTDDNQIKIEYSEEVKEEILQNTSEEIVVVPQETTEGTSTDTAAEAASVESATEGTSVETTTDSNQESSDIQAAGPIRSFFAGLFGRTTLGSFFNIFAPLKVYAAGEGVSVEGRATAIPGMKITDVSVAKNPSQNQTTGEWYGGTPITNGAEVENGETLLFQLNYMLEKNTVSVEKPTVTYDLTGVGINVSAPLSGDVTNSNNAVVGSFTVGTDSVVKITFKPEFAALNSEHPIEDGSFFFVMQAHKVTEELEERIEYDFGDNIKFDIKIIKSDRYDLSLNKTASEYNATDKSIHYKITITTNNGTGKDGIKLTDFFKVYNVGYGRTGENSQLTEKMVQNEQTVTATMSITRNDGTTYDVWDPNIVSNNGGTEMYINLPDLDQGQSYTIEYTYKLPTEVAETTAEIAVDNGVKAKYFNNREAEAHIQTDIKGRVPDISKEGKIKENAENTVTWTIKLNTEKNNLNGYTLKDNRIVLSRENGWEYIHEPYTGKLKVLTVDGTGGSLVVNQEIELGENGYTFKSDDYCTYEFTYEQTFTVLDLAYGKLVNEAIIYKGTDGNTIVSNPEVGPSHPVEKKGDGISVEEGDTNLANLKWILTIHGPINPEEGTNNSEYWTFGDAIQDNYQVVTEAQLAAFEVALQSELQRVGYNGNYVIEKNDWTSIAVDGHAAVEGYRSFSVKFYARLDSDITLSYYTTGYIGDGAKTFTNKAYVRNIYFGQDAHQGYEPMVAKYDLNNNHDTKTYDYYSDSLFGSGILTWKIRVNIPEQCKYEELKVIDTLPDDVELIDTYTYKGETVYGLEVADNGGLQNSAAFSGGIANLLGTEFSEEVSGNNVVVKFNTANVKGKTLYFGIRAKITNPDWTGAVDGKRSFTNGVSLEDGGGVDLGVDSQTTEVTKNETFLKKQSTRQGLDAHDTIEYTLDVNENAADLLPEGDELTLTDTLTARSQNQFSSLLLSDSIYVYQVTTDENGNEIETVLPTNEYSYHVSSYETEALLNNNGQNLYVLFSTIEFKIPDKKHIRIKYRYTFNGDQGIQISVSNEAVLKGIAVEKSIVTTDDSFSIEDAGAKANIRGIDILKVDNDNQAIVLGGAEFALYRWNDINTNNPWERVFYNETAKAWEVVANVKDAYVYTSGEDGKVPIDNLVYNQVYKVVETKAPSNYILKSKPMYFYMPSTDTNKYPRIIPDTTHTDGEPVSAINQGANAIFTNTSNKTHIDIEKYWDNPDDTMPESIEVNIGRRLGSETDDVKDSYWSLHVDHRDNLNIIHEYKGYPSIKDGTTVKITFDVYFNWDCSVIDSPIYVQINGEQKDISTWSRSGSGRTQSMTYEFPIHEDTTFVIRDNSWGSINYNIGVDIGEAPSQSSTSQEEALQIDEPVIKRITLTKSSEWKARVDDLERYYVVTKEDGSVERYLWLYYISEVNSVYYTASYSDNNRTGINSGTLTLTNTRNNVQPYVLPSTGGIGDDPIKAAGLGFMGLALLGSGAYIYRRRRRKKKFSKV